MSRCEALDSCDLLLAVVFEDDVMFLGIAEFDMVGGFRATVDWWIQAATRANLLVEFSWLVFRGAGLATVVLAFEAPEGPKSPGIEKDARKAIKRLDWSEHAGAGYEAEGLVCFP